MSAKKIGILVFALAAVALVGAALTQSEKAGSAPTSPEDFIFKWTVPTGGTTPVSYDVEIRKGGADSGTIMTTTTPTNSISVPVSNFTIKYEVRVRGVDSEGRRGPWSEWSDEYDRPVPNPNGPNSP